MLKLFFAPGRAFRAKWILDEIRVPYRLVTVDLAKGEHRSPEYLAINPAGRLPTLIDGNQTITESGAICLYLADKYPEASLAPSPDAPDRGRYLSLMLFGAASHEPSIIDRICSRETAKGSGWGDAAETGRLLEREIGAGPYLFGSWFTAADIVIGVGLLWCRFAQVPLASPALDAYLDRLMARPAAPKRPDQA